MNEKFRSLITAQGWEPGEVTNSWHKTYSITVNGNQHNVVVETRFYWFNAEGYPQELILKPKNPTKIQPNNANSTTKLMGKFRIICLLEQAGLAAAFKALCYGNKIDHFKNDAKAIMAGYSLI